MLGRSSLLKAGGAAFAATGSDPFFSSVSLLLHGNGANGSTTIIDSSPSPKTVTAAGNAQISTAQSRFDGASIALDGSGSYLQVPRSAAFDFETGNFTIEAWCRFGTSGDIAIVGGVGPINGTLMIRRLGDNTLRLGRNLVGWDVTSPQLTWATNQFYYIAATKSGGIVRLFRDSAEVASAANPQSYALASPSDSFWAVGASQSIANTFSPGQFMGGNVDELRITKGIARDVSVVPSAPFPDA
jgi:hypothetical protein